jgi:hypothetical protein
MGHFRPSFLRPKGESLSVRRLPGRQGCKTHGLFLLRKSLPCSPLILQGPTGNGNIMGISRYPSANFKLRRDHTEFGPVEVLGSSLGTILPPCRRQGVVTVEGIQPFLATPSSNAFEWMARSLTSQGWNTSKRIQMEDLGRTRTLSSTGPSSFPKLKNDIMWYQMSIWWG